MNYKFKIFEVKDKKELEVASGEGANQKKIEAECSHYAMMYSQDGEIRIWRNYEEEKIVNRKPIKG